MKYVKSFGLAAVAAMALMAFLGAGSASATALCKTNIEGACPFEWIYPAGTVIEMSLEEGTNSELWFVNSNGEESGTQPFVKCTGSTLEAEAQNVGGAASIKALTLEGCTQSTSVTGLGEFQVSWTGGHDGQLNGQGTNIQVTSLLFGTCVYGSGPFTNLGKITGGMMATVEISSNLTKLKEGKGCPVTTRWTAKYTVSSPEPLYVTGP